MINILINDGIHPTGKKMLEDAGYNVDTEKIAQEDLMSRLPQYNVICVRSATKVREELISNCPNLKIIARGGVGLDNIDVDFAKSQGVEVYNTPAAASRSVAELAFAHMLSLSRFVYQSNRNMPEKGQDEFGKLKKSYSKGYELQGKKLGIIGLGRIGREVARIGLGMGMDVLAVDHSLVSAKIWIGSAKLGLETEVYTTSMDDMLTQADYITLHIPHQGNPVLDKSAFDKMKDGVIIVNAARGGTIDESALLDALESQKVKAAGLDVFENEPTPQKAILEHPNISLTPHIGASTEEAQEKIGIELAQQIIDYFNR